MTSSGELAASRHAWRLLGAAVLFLVVPVLCVLAARATGLVPTGADGKVGAEDRLAAVLGGTAVAAVALIAYARVLPPGAPWRPFALGGTAVRWLPATAVWVLFLVAYLRGRVALGAPVAPQPGLDFLVHASTADPRWWIAAVTVAVGAPIAEELLFRGYLLDLARNWLSTRAAVVAVAVVFGSMHGLDYALPVVLLGVLFGWMRVRHGALWPAVIAHAANNLLVTVVLRAWPSILDYLYPR